ncbi:MAG: hypothetical protein JOZ02_09675 [Acidobacteria bacterium]|nr:hypothetical protein [Acidobacteriota bacterium]
MTQKRGDCYIDVWREADFRGETVRIYGPGEYASLELAEGNWADDIGSLRVGPNAFVVAYRRRDFQDEPVTFGPDDEIPDLSQFKFDDDIESMKVIDSLKIFNHLEYNSSLFPEPPDEVAAGPSEPWPNPNKSRRWKDKKR